MLAKFGNTDITKYIEDETYNCNSENIYQTWVDANLITHRVVSRSKVSGSFNVLLRAGWTTSITDFLNIIKASKGTNSTIGDYYDMTLWVDNLGTSKSIKAYIDTQAERTRLSNDDVVIVLNVTFEEA